MTPDEIVADLRDGMTIGFGGWGSRRKPMALVRAILRSPLKDLTVVSYAGPDVGLLVASGQARRVVTGFASLDSIPLEPNFRRARQDGTVELTELDEGMLHWGLLAAAHRLPFLPIRAGLGSGVLEVNPELRTVRSPYPDEEELVAMPALRLDAALVHMNRADAAGNGQYLGPDPYFDDLFCLAAERAYVSCERIVPRLDGLPQTLLLNRAMVHGVAETPNGAHFTSCVPDYGRDEAFQKRYAAAAADPEEWRRFEEQYLAGGEGGGHVGAVPTSLLVPQVAAAVDIPVIAAGGFFDGRGLVAALAWGAAGIAMGTRFLLTSDSPVPAAVKQLYLAAGLDGTVVTTRVDGVPHRMLRTTLVDHLEGARARTAAGAGAQAGATRWGVARRPAAVIRAARSAAAFRGCPG
jgi:glutaconate CoA-transferase subunit A